MCKCGDVYIFFFQCIYFSLSVLFTVIAFALLCGILFYHQFQRPLAISPKQIPWKSSWRINHSMVFYYIASYCVVLHCIFVALHRIELVSVPLNIFLYIFFISLFCMFEDINCFFVYLVLKTSPWIYCALWWFSALPKHTLIFCTLP